MSVVDLHPEELLEKDATGELDALERDRLEAHLARCAPCRFERQVRADFVEELSAKSPGENFGLASVTNVTSGGTHGMPGSALETPAPRESMTTLRGAGEGDRPSRRPPVATRVRPRRRTTRVAWLLAAAALLVGGVATAMELVDGDWPRLIGMGSDPVPVLAPAEVRTADPVQTKVRRIPAALPELPPPAEPASETPEPIAPVVETQQKAPPPARALSAPGPPPVGPSDLFEAENVARQRGDYGRALDIDRDLETRYPTSREAQVSRAIVGRLLLDRGDPSRALGNFDSYLAAGSGDLREEAMVGRATALDRLGRSDEAAEAWSQLLTAFPATPYASHARARSESLNGH